MAIQNRPFTKEGLENYDRIFKPALKVVSCDHIGFTHCGADTWQCSKCLELFSFSQVCDLLDDEEVTKKYQLDK